MPLVNRTFDQLINFTRTTAATFVGSNGLIQTTPQSRNLLTFTEEFDNAAWVKSSATVAANSVAAPDGTMTADTLTASGANGTALQTFTASAVPYTFSVWLRRLTGTGNVQLTVDGTTYATVTLTTAWARFETTLTPSAGSRTAGVRIVTSGDAVYAWGAQLEQASAATDYTRNFGGLFPPRFDYDPVTLAPRGLLIEEQRTNLLLRSEEFDNASWSKLRATVTANSTTAPDGTTTADTLLDTAVAGTHVAIQTTAKAASAITYAASVWLKADVRDQGELRVSDQAGNGVRCTFNLTTAAVGAAATFGTGFTAVSSQISQFANGWYRVVLVATSNTATTIGHEVYIANASGSISYTGTGAGFFVWGAQLEAGAFATSYIPTVASQVTRTADTAAIQAPNFASWFNQTEGTFVAEFDTVAPASRFAVYASDGTSNNLIGIEFSSGGQVRGRITTAGVSQASMGAGAAISANAVVNAGIAYATNSAIAASEGTLSTEDTSVTLPTLNQLSIGTSLGSTFLNGHIRSIRYYPGRLSNAQLQALTA